ncbi:YfhO family protein [uncultured Flavobacterium sp.]|uniref:YfhO family protein n=1 Tax=uncultured Flavobacterium sp. TaxID=165435 RepID=UPI0025D18FF5|nr:YfhO family protein [uncultured Flavobacterium sp.]
MKNLNRIYPHLLAVIGFITVALIYFYPVLQGKQMLQSDIVQYTGMAKEQNDFRKATGEEPYWTNSAFGGMPTYQMGANYPHNYIKQLDSAIRFLPRPADYMFVYFIGFYILLCTLKMNPLKAFFGALAFGLSTYLVIILGVGHNAKAHAIAYMPMVVAGVLLVFRREYIVGGLLTMVAAALEINANHFQMTYYLLLLLLVIGIYYPIDIIRGKQYRHLAISAGVFVVAGLLALGANAANLMATSEYANASIRGKSELTTNPDGSKNVTDSSMEYDYITEYSYGKAESFNLIAPRLFGGGGQEDLGRDSHMYDYVTGLGADPSQADNFVKGMPTYWGDQPIVEAPAYIGAIVFFLALLCLFIDKRKLKYAFLAGAILSLLLSWGKNFPALTDFFIYNIPFYDKFRAVSSIQVILELCMPVLAFMGLQAFFKSDGTTQWKALWMSAAAALGTLVLLLLVKGQFDFAGLNDARYDEMFGKLPGFIDALIQQRKDMYTSDLLRSGLFIIAAAAILWFYTKNKISNTVAVIIVGLLVVSDLFFIDRNYVNKDNFVSASKVNTPFDPTPADDYILKDTANYRVYSFQGRLQGRTSYFHKAVGGYSAVRPRRFEQLFNYIVEPGISNIVGSIDQQSMSFSKPVPVLDMLNVKYVLLPANDEGEVPVTNPFANGPAWFVKSVKAVDNADGELQSLKEINSKDVAVINKKEFAGAVKKTSFAADSTATIKLAVHQPNYLKYTTDNNNEGLAVFSEMYYADGWNAFIGGKPAPHFRADYVLRAMNVPQGKHTIEFKFEPQVVKTGSKIALYSFIGMLLLLAGGIYFETRKHSPLIPKRGDRNL